MFLVPPGKLMFVNVTRIRATLCKSYPFGEQLKVFMSRILIPFKALNMIDKFQVPFLFEIQVLLLLNCGSLPLPLCWSR